VPARRAILRRRLHAIAAAGLLALLGGLLAAPAAPAATATFGANLNRPADSPYTCAHTSIAPVPSCTVNSTNVATGESSFPPIGEGIVSAVRVRVGPQTGPMQIVVEEALRQDNPFEAGRPNYACCKLIAASQIFTPAANAVTQVPIDFRVRQDLSPDQNGIYVDQHLGLSVLAPNVPIPASLDNSGFNSMGVWWPAWQRVGEERVGPAGSLVNPVVLMNADWDPVGTPAAPVVPGAVPALSIPNRRALVANERARVALACGLDTTCVGRLLLQSRQANPAARVRLGARAAARRTVTFGSVKFKIKAGKRATVRVKLNRKGKRLLRKQGQPKVWANVQMKGQIVQPRRITLKPAPRKASR
jgi:hypothetical protein